ncbi:hypothetical protein CSPX01_11968 [Colletotrichum filicis]|nr:hypothetical protein CSPX01_11968 [Colletotrichum filicis]
MLSNAFRRRALPSAVAASCPMPLAVRIIAASGARFLSDKPGLVSTDIRDIADAKKTNLPQPKISNASVNGEKLTEEQQREVDEHNKDFEKKYDLAPAAEDDKVDKKFWLNK